MLLHTDAVKSNFFVGKPSDEANQLNDGMVKTFMTFSCQQEASSEASLKAEQNSKPVDQPYRAANA